MTKDGTGLARLARLAPLALLGLATPSWAQDDLVAEGEGVFRRCAACHEIGEGAEHRVGPELNGIIGRTAGTAEGYAYSDAMVEAGAGGLVWTAETLDPYLARPREMVPGTKMAFAGLRKPEDIAAVIAYLEAAGGEATDGGAAGGEDAGGEEAGDGS